MKARRGKGSDCPSIEDLVLVRLRCLIPPMTLKIAICKI
jgi:hypothetical protein